MWLNKEIWRGDKGKKGLSSDGGLTKRIKMIVLISYTFPFTI